MPAGRTRGPGSPLTGIALAIVGASPLLLGLYGCTPEAAPNAGSKHAQRAADLRLIQLPVEGMSCAVCAARVEKALASIGGVSEVEVSLLERRARVRFDPSRLSPGDLVAAIEGLGYHAGTPEEPR